METSCKHCSELVVAELITVLIHLLITILASAFGRGVRRRSISSLVFRIFLCSGLLLICCIFLRIHSLDCLKLRVVLGRHIANSLSSDCLGGCQLLVISCLGGCHCRSDLLVIVLCCGCVVGGSFVLDICHLRVSLFFCLSDLLVRSCGILGGLF